MKLLTKANRDALPALYSTENTPTEDKTAVVKFFTPWAGWTWYATEFDGEDTFFGFVVSGIDPTLSELGYFSLSEFEATKGPWGLTIERDMHFNPTKLSELDDVKGRI